MTMPTVSQLAEPAQEKTRARQNLEDDVSDMEDVVSRIDDLVDDLGRAVASLGDVSEDVADAGSWLCNVAESAVLDIQKAFAALCSVLDDEDGEDGE